MIIYINDIKVDLPENLRFARTKQVNTIGSLNNRQSNFSFNVAFPKTKHNIENVFRFLGNQSNNSNIPYIINTAKVYNDNGDCEIYNGYAVVKNTNNAFNVVFYDGYIEFVKAIENRTLTEAGLTDLNHLKTLDSVVNTWVNDLPYRYIVADYNGNNVVDEKINIDYLIPSVKASYLWEKVHQYSGFTYEGSVFDTQDFKNLWITYPKTIGEGTQVSIDVADFLWDEPILTIFQDPFSSEFIYENRLTSSFPLIDNQYISGLPDFASLGNSKFVVGTTGAYKIDLVANVTNLIHYNKNGQIRLAQSWLKINKYTNGVLSVPFFINASTSETSTHSPVINFEQGDEFEIVGGFAPAYGNTVSIDINIIEGNTVDFEEAFIGFDMSDFVNEVLWQFALTPFKDKYTNNIKYLTHQEWLQTLDVVDWSADKNKFVRNVNETYTSSGYAQRNYLRYKYNDKDASHYDGFLSIENANLKDKTDIINSKMYAPEAEKTTILNNNTNVYKFWDKEPQENGTIKYKDLSNRFYLMRGNYKDEAVNVTSELTNQNQGVSGYYLESFANLDFNNVVDKYYAPIYSMLNTARLLTAEIYLNDNDIANLDFKKLVYIKEESSYFIINKIPNYIGRGVYKVELIEIDYVTTEAVITPPPVGSIFATCEAIPPSVLINNWRIKTDYAFVNYTPNSATIKAQQLDGFFGNPTGYELNDSISLASNTHTFNFPEPLTNQGYFRVRITDDLGNNPYAFQVALSNTGYISVKVFNSSYGVNSLFRDIQYTFHNFTPVNANIRIKTYNTFLNQPIGDWLFTEQLTELTQDVVHQLTNVFIGTSSQFLLVEVTTNTSGFSQIIEVQ